MSLREDARRALLAAYAPVMILNDWGETDAKRIPKVKVIPLPELHPLVAQGVVEFLNDGENRLPKDVSVTLRPYLASIAARASI